MAMERCCVGRGVAAIRHKSGSRSITYCAMRELRLAFDLFHSSGTVFGSINGKAIRGLKFVAAPSELVTAFDADAGQLDALIESNTKESRALAASRDVLLPRLLNER